MSVQFGIWNFDGQPVDPEYLEQVNALLAPYGPDGCSSYSASGLAILHHSFHTTKESRREKQPHISNSGAVIAWDGRLDTRSELIRELADVLTASSTDVEIAAAAYEEWGENSFTKLIGDWAVSIWNPATRSLILAKDAIGTRQLHYAMEEQRITWSTILDPLVMLAGRKFQLCEEYIAGWLGFFPATHLTPYVGIESVSPSSFVRLQRGKREIRKYWDFDPHKRIRYQTDGEYEEHFRIVFGESVRRRLRSDSPILAELSGGMDSSSIVCMADEIIGRGLAETPRLDTISYYDDTEPSWNELPYLTKIEDKRGRRGCHIAISSDTFFRRQFQLAGIAITPASVGTHSKSTRDYRAFLSSRAARVVLSGIGGDEVAGGVPTPFPALADSLSRGHILALTRQLKTEALLVRKPWLHLFLDTVRPFLPPSLFRTPTVNPAVAWLAPCFTRPNREALLGYQKRAHLFGPLPSFQAARKSLDGPLRLISSTPPAFDPPFEPRYPFLDRSLLEFLFAVPPEQLVRPGQRRSLVRRSFVGLVPKEVLSRRRKAFVCRAPLRAISRELGFLRSVCVHMLSTSARIVDQNEFGSVLQAAGEGRQIAVVGVLRTIALEAWMRSTYKHGVLKTTREGREPCASSPECLRASHSHDLS